MTERLYLDSDQPVKARVEDLLARMTLQEKVGQMAGAVLFNLERAKEDIKTYHLGAGDPMMFVNSPQDLANFTNAIQKFAIEETRLGIPLLLYMDAVH